MKKVDFMSPEALLQTEMFGNGSDIFDAYDLIQVNGESSNIILFAYFDAYWLTGVFWINFIPLSQDCNISIGAPGTPGHFSNDILSNVPIYVNDNYIEFNEITTGISTTVCGRFTLSDSSPIIAD